MPDTSRDQHPDPQPEKAGKHPLNATLSGLPELDQFRTAAEREAALREIAHQASNVKSGWYWLAIAILVGSVLAVRWIAKWGLNRVVWPFWLEEAIVWTSILVTFWLVLRRLHRWGAADELRAKLLKTGIPVCTRCGYSLRGLSLTTARCPECGTAFDPRVRDLLSNRDAGAKGS